MGSVHSYSAVVPNPYARSVFVVDMNLMPVDHIAYGGHICINWICCVAQKSTVKWAVTSEFVSQVDCVFDES